MARLSMRARLLCAAVAPSVLRRSADGLSREIPEARLWGAVLTVIPIVLALMLQAHLSVSLRRLRIFGQRDKLKADRSKGA
jgi:hypothetical protein